MTPEEQDALNWYGNLILTECLPCPVCGAGVAHFAPSALIHKRWHEARGEVVAPYPPPLSPPPAPAQT